MTKPSAGHLYILATTDYFSKWVEAVLLKEFKKETVVDFIKSYIIYQFKQHNSSMYSALPNELAEAFNKTLGNLLKNVVTKSKWDWHERIGEALWIPSLKIAIQKSLTDDENAKLRLAELEALDEKRLEAQQKLECYQAHLSKAFNKKWDGPYMVTEVYTNGAYKIVDKKGTGVGPINDKFLKRYYS
ncbi:uncharacterized protein LOC114291828 [Camellia sinensis]|uniref:uncharacterized protein LOC114291828 n=1 Tax=Camellia sinensis TaxID=4442 RepID=UPI001036DE23|nr:uncharacterized protein LOC114291828 [Camellia sinensis]